MSEVEAGILKEIQDNGPISQARFMELALQSYYQNHASIGHDFITAPEVSQVFGELIGIWLLDIYKQLGSPPKVVLVELGPGRGTLLADILRVSKLCSSFFEAIEVYLVETSPRLIKIQKEIISHPSVKWISTFADLPEVQAPLLVIANEFLDIFPVRCYVRKNHHVYERCIGSKEDKLCFVLRKMRGEMGPDKIWEESPSAGAFLQCLCERLSYQKGAFLCLDYGYEEGEGDTLQSICGGKPIDPLTRIGESDMTCHVNFRDIKGAALSKSLKVEGPLPQGLFLHNLHIDKRIAHLKYLNPCQKDALEAAYLRLTHPSQMGLIFKALAIVSPDCLNPLGFTANGN